MQASIGQVVRTKRNGYLGIVKAKHHDFQGVKEGMGWFHAQRPKISKDELVTPWYEILVHGGGAVNTFEADVEVVTDGSQVENPYIEFYFGKK